ncbi:MAG TPA: ABC transporter permease [Nitrospiria bacterium]|nr:ABC transporter permease [Nitrospiria bacterium]
MNAIRPILALAGKEIRVATASPILYVVAGVFLAIVGLFFSQIVTIASLQSLQMMRFQGALPQLNLTVLVFQPMFRNIHVILLLVIPLLTMRLLSEERKHKTFELLMTSPITVTQLVAGKYLAVLALYAGLLAFTLYMPLLLGLWGPIDWPTVLSGYLGLLLVGSVYLALGLVASSLTENQISAGVVALGLMLGWWLLGWAAVTAENPAVRAVLEYVSVTSHFDRFIKGLLSLDSVVYSVSLAAFSLFLTHRVLDAGRWRETG